MRAVHLLVLLFTIAAGAAQGQSETYGALAMDRRSDNFRFAFSHDHPSAGAAEERARQECARLGGKCHVVLLWSGRGCASFRAVDRKDGDAFGWGTGPTLQEADRRAMTEVLKRSGGKLALNHVMACNARGSAGAKVLKQQTSALAAGAQELQRAAEHAARGDYVHAFPLFKRHADAGDRVAQYNLAQMYRQGLGLPKNLPEALRLYRLAAESGFGPAEYALGIAYLKGEGVAKDERLGYAWLRRAGASGHKLANETVGSVRPRLSDRDRIAAERMAEGAYAIPPEFPAVAAPPPPASAPPVVAAAPPPPAAARAPAVPVPPSGAPAAFPSAAGGGGERQYSDWKRARSQKPIFARFALVRQEGSIGVFQLQLRVDTQDEWHCNHPRCNGYVFVASVGETQQLHVRFPRGVHGPWTYPEPVRVEMAPSDGWKVDFTPEQGFSFSRGGKSEAGAPPWIVCAHGPLDTDNLRSYCRDFQPERAIVAN